MKAIVLLESEKIKRTGFLPAFLGGGLLAGMVPVVNMILRWERYTSLPGSPFSVLMEANWRLMAQLNILLLVCGACILYHAEYENNGIQKTESLPVSIFHIYRGKRRLLFLTTLLPLCLETLSLLLCCIHWFPAASETDLSLLKGMAFELVLLLPTAAAMLFLSSLCRNIWVSLGMGVILVFMASMLPQTFFTAMIPFCAPYRMLSEFSSRQALVCLAACAAEIILFSVAELIYIKIRRCFT